MNHPRQITLNDIARACGVSRATVSLVLRGSPLVRDLTRRRVEAEMQRQGYVYNRTAAGLRRRLSSEVALVINDLSNPFFGEFAAGVDEALGMKGYVTLLGSSNGLPARQRQVLGSLMEYHPAGIILSPVEASDAADVEMVIGRQTPLLVFNRELENRAGIGLNYDYLGFDDRAGASSIVDADPRARGRQATELLLQRAAMPSLLRRSIIVPVQLAQRGTAP